MMFIVILGFDFRTRFKNTVIVWFLEGYLLADSSAYHMPWYHDFPCFPHSQGEIMLYSQRGNKVTYQTTLHSNIHYVIFIFTTDNLNLEILSFLSHAQAIPPGSLALAQIAWICIDPIVIEVCFKWMPSCHRGCLLLRWLHYLLLKRRIPSGKVLVLIKQVGFAGLDFMFLHKGCWKIQ